MSTRAEPLSERHLPLHDLYLVQGITSFGFTLFIMCVFFWTRDRYGFSHAENLLLGALGGGVYMLSARSGGRLGDRLGYHRMVIIALSCAALCVLCGWCWPWRYTPFVMNGCYVFCFAILWPCLEAGVLHAPGTLSMPRRLGIYNMTWSATAALGFFVGGAFFAWRPSSVIWGPGLLHLVTVLWILLRYRRHPVRGVVAMDIPHRGTNETPARKRLFTYVSWNANTVAYFMLGAFSALTPYLGERLGLSPYRAIWIACMPLLARTVSFWVFWHWEGWHYHMAWCRAAVWVAPVGLGLLFFGDAIPLVLAGATVFGLAIGLSYYMSLYYTLDYNTNKGEGGGCHEALIGLGYLSGPLVGALAASLTGSAYRAQIGVLTLAVGLTGIGRVVAGIRARRGA
jgi:MFS family permease